MEEWLDGWTHGVLPLRRKLGFEIEGAWVMEGQSKFVWLLSYDGPEAWEEKEAAYYASQERQTLDPDPRLFIANVEQWFLRPVSL